MPEKTDSMAHGPVAPHGSAVLSLEERIETARHNVEALARLEDFGIRRTFHGFYYISHYYPLKAQSPITPAGALDAITQLAEPSFETYIHFPFCEYICTFCHFHKRPMGSTQNYAAKEDDALGLVEAEMALYHDVLGGPIDARSLQIGGGTPSLISNRRLARHLDKIREHMSIRPGAEIKIEIYPQDYDEGDLREKLRILKDFGFTDLVVDLESGNSQTLRYINRPRSSLEAYVKVLEIAAEEGHDSVITAIMAGLPFETFESLDHTIQTLMKMPQVRVFNVFPTIMRENDPISHQYRRNPENFHDEKVRDQMWIFARDTMRAMGYVEGPISYLHHPDARPDQQQDKFECVNLLGLGCSSFGYLNGPDWAAQYYNYIDPVEYSQAVKAGHLPIWRLGRYGQDERARRKVIFGLANVKTENLVEIESRYGVSIDEIYGRVFNALHQLGLIAIDRSGQGIYYTEAGLCRLEEITYFLYSTFAKDACDRLPDPDDRYYKDLVTQHYAVTMPVDDRERFERFAANQSSDFMSKIRG